MHFKANFGAGGLQKWSLEFSKNVIKKMYKISFQNMSTNVKKHIYNHLKSYKNNVNTMYKSYKSNIKWYTGPCGSIRAHMGPYGPVWARISFYVAFIWSIHCFYTVFIWFKMVVYMIFESCVIFSKLIWHIFITFLEKFKDHFCSPPAPKFAL